ncbi:MAG: hypothetical protein IIB60_02455 [Planctomycetes bacterium]|nr:hypothetical protein [Planctomycetota bacterium]
MLDSILLILAAGLSDLTTLYWICFVVGGGLLLISTLLGGHADTDVDASFDLDPSVDVDVSLDADVSFDADIDVDLDIGVDVDVGHIDAGGGDLHLDPAGVTSLASWFSIRFVIFAMAVFGLIGVVLTHLTDTSSGLIAGSAVLGGLIFGQGVHQLFRKLRQTSGNSALQPGDYVDKLARVTIAIRSKQKGEIALRVRRAERFIPAVAKHEDGTFNTGEVVAVVDYVAGMAEVVSRKEYEFLKDEDEGDKS